MATACLPRLRGPVGVTKVATILLAALAGGSLTSGAAADPAPAAPQAVGRTVGFVLSTFRHAAYDGGAADCPQGLNLAAGDVYSNALPPKERAKLLAGDAKKELHRILFNGAKGLYDRTTPNACNAPADYMKPGYKDPAWRTVEGKVAYGMNLDGGDGSAPVPGTCAHAKFASPAGEPVDNQLWRAIGCVKYYRPGADLQTYADSTIKSGEITILVELTGVDDLRNDDDVGVSVYSSTDPVPTDASGNILAGGSLQVHDDARFHTATRGRIKDGVLTSDPVDLRVQNKALIIDSERLFRAARLRLELQPDGSAKGMLGGYYDVASFYDYVQQSTISTAILGGYTCPSLYASLHELADGFPDAAGRCTAISAAWDIAGVPAFVIHPRTDTAAAPGRQVAAGGAGR